MDSCDRPPTVNARDAFGPNLRRIRIQRGICLTQIAQGTNVRVDLWEAMERNDFTLWPSGIFARAHIRMYALAIGVDPDTTVDDFCRWFPQGDRRFAPWIRGYAAIVGHELKLQDGVPPSVLEGDRRALEAIPSGAAADPQPRRLAAFGYLFGRLRRTFGRA
jgi:hypothetical protein